jgi:hypothetical protein
VKIFAHPASVSASRCKGKVLVCGRDPGSYAWCHEQTSGLERMIGPRGQSLNDACLLAIEESRHLSAEKGTSQIG